MYTATSQDLFFLILAIVTGGIGIFLCWALYEVARMLHQANDLFEDTRERISAVEDFVVNIKDQLTSSMSYVSVLAKGGMKILDHFRRKQKIKFDEDDEDEDDEDMDEEDDEPAVRKSRKRSRK